MKIKAYKVVSEDSIDNINDVVESMLQDGWIPQGGVSVSMAQANFDGFAVMYCQAMVLPDDEI